MIILAMVGVTTLVFGSNDCSSLIQLDEDKEQRTEIEIKDLPVAVKEGWKESGYDIEKVEKIYKVTTENEEYIEFIVKSEKEKKAIHFDMEGKKIREKTLT